MVGFHNLEKLIEKWYGMDLIIRLGWKDVIYGGKKRFLIDLLYRKYGSITAVRQYSKKLDSFLPYVVLMVIFISSPL